MQPNVTFISVIVLAVVCLFISCEWLIYYVVLHSCDWPSLDPKNEDHDIPSSNENPVKVMVMADTHLLGSREGNWYDKLRREWQMYRAFQTAMYLHQPEVVFVLGDLTDEGYYCSDEEFNYYINRFRSLFYIPKNTSMYVAVGNHDIGFHYRVTPYLNQRFVKGFNATAVQLISIRGNHFVLVNSIALEGDGCDLCRSAERELVKIEKLIKCAKDNRTSYCNPKNNLKTYSRPILMQHYPLYRTSDKDCNEPDEAPYPIKIQKMREGWDCLTKESTTELLKQINPRLVMSGHTHHGCTKQLPNGKGIEISVSSFSWRNKNNPSYELVTFTPNNYAISKCLMPQENTIINIYIIGIAVILFSVIFSLYKGANKKKFKYH